MFQTNNVIYQNLYLYTFRNKTEYNFIKRNFRGMWWCWCAEKNRVRRRRQNLVSLDNYGDFFHRRGNWALLLFAPMVSRQSHYT